jgi:hypothetical protein
MGATAIIGLLILLIGSKQIVNKVEVSSAAGAGMAH